jgi:hypothetical protein
VAFFFFIENTNKAFCPFSDRLIFVAAKTTFSGVFALGIAVEIFCEATNKRLQRIARPEGERPNKMNNYERLISGKRGMLKKRPLLPYSIEIFIK